MHRRSIASSAGRPRSDGSWQRQARASVKMSSYRLLLPESAAVSLPWTEIESGLPSLPVLRPEPRSGNDRIGNQREFCNIVGGVASPLFANIYLDRLDRYVEQTLIPAYTKGRAKRIDPE